MTHQDEVPFDRGDAVAAVERLFRNESPIVLATLTRHLGDLQLAEDALQDALASAIAAWPTNGVPDNPAAWITVTARRSAIDRLRRTRSLADRTERLAELSRLESQANDSDPASIQDDQLRLIFTCCHPALNLPSRIALTLRTVGGLSTAEVARTLLVSEPTMAQRLTRAKRQIRDKNIPYRIPSPQELTERVAAVLKVIYLIFTEGHLASEGERLVRTDLCTEAIRLGRLLVNLLPREAEAQGLLALMLLHDARQHARIDSHGSFVSLADQDRSSWNREEIDAGVSALRRALQLQKPGPFQLQAAIAALHAEAPSADQTDWTQIAEIYAALARLDPSPVIEVNRAVATAFAEGPAAGVRILEPFLIDPDLERYQPLHAAHAELRRQMGDFEAAAEAYRRAIQLTTNNVEARELRQRLADLRGETA